MPGRPPLLLLTSLLWIAAIATPGRVLADDPTAAGRYAGHYRHAGGELEARSLEQLVERTVDGFTPLLRPIARGRLEKTVVVPDAIEITETPAGISVRAVGASDLPDEPRIENGAIVVRQSNFEGSRQTSFRLTEDGTTLIMHVTTRSRLLRDDIDYRLTFERVGPDLAGATASPAPAVPVSSPLDSSISSSLASPLSSSASSAPGPVSAGPDAGS